VSLFALAEKGHSLAVEIVEEHAGEVGKLAASITALLDPGLVVLGGALAAIRCCCRCCGHSGQTEAGRSTSL